MDDEDEDDADDEGDVMHEERDEECDDEVTSVAAVPSENIEIGRTGVGACGRI